MPQDNSKEWEESFDKMFGAIEIIEKSQGLYFRDARNDIKIFIRSILAQQRQEFKVILEGLKQPRDVEMSEKDYWVFQFNTKIDAVLKGLE